MTEKQVKQDARAKRRADARPLYEIARDISRDWKNPYFGAVPYLAALKELDRVTDLYGQDDGHTIVIYFLSNATTWRGPIAREIKKELKEITR